MLSPSALSRPNTVSFSVPGLSSSRDAYSEIGTLVTSTYGRDGVQCFQARGSSSFLMSFGSQAHALRAVEEGFVYREQRLQVTEVTSGITTVTLTDAPFELPHERIVKALSYYGRVKRVSHVKADPAVGDFFTGDRRVILEMKKRVPNFLTIDGFEVVCWYRDVARLCRRCGEEGHIAADCTVPAARPKRCSNCGNRWHQAVDCQGCFRCHTEAHGPTNCPAYDDLDALLTEINDKQRLATEKLPDASVSDSAPVPSPDPLVVPFPSPSSPVLAVSGPAPKRARPSPSTDIRASDSESEMDIEPLSVLRTEISDTSKTLDSPSVAAPSPSLPASPSPPPLHARLPSSLVRNRHQTEKFRIFRSSP